MIFKPPTFAHLNPRHPLSRNCVLFLAINEGGGLTAFDAARGHQATINATEAGDWIATEYGLALNLDGNPEHLTVTAHPDFQFTGSSFTVSAILRDDTPGSSLGTYHRILSVFDGTNSVQIGLARDTATGSQRRFYLLYASANSKPQITTTGDAPTGARKVIISFDASTATYRMFMDGVANENTNLQVNTANVFEGNQNLHIAWRGDLSGTHVTGDLIKLAIYKGTAFGDAEAAMDAADPFGPLRSARRPTAGFVPPPPGPGGGAPVLAAHHYRRRRVA